MKRGQDALITDPSWFHTNKSRPTRKMDRCWMDWLLTVTDLLWSLWTVLSAAELRQSTGKHGGTGTRKHIQGCLFNCSLERSTAKSADDWLANALQSMPSISSSNMNGHASGSQTSYVFDIITKFRSSEPASATAAPFFHYFQQIFGPDIVSRTKLPYNDVSWCSRAVYASINQVPNLRGDRRSSL